MADDESGGIRQYADSFFNLLTGFGTEKDRVTQNEVGFQVFEDQARLEELYRTDHYAAKIVDSLPNDSTRQGFVVGEENEYDEELDRLGIVQKLCKTDKWARLYGGAALVLGIEDGQDPREPVDPKKVKGISYAYVVDRWSLSRLDMQNDPKKPGFGLPERYRVTPRDMIFHGAMEGDGTSDPSEADYETEGYGSVVHVSRMVRMYGVELPTTIRAQQDYWGDSVLHRARKSLSNLSVTESAIGNTLQMFTQAIFRKKGLATKVRSKKGRDELLSLFSIMNMSQSMLGMMIVDADGEDFERRSTNVTGMADLYDRLAQSAQSAAHQPASRFFGIIPGGLSTNDDAGERWWNDEVQAHQRNVYNPAIQYIATLMQIAEGGGPEPVFVEARPLSRPTEQEKAQTQKTKAETAAILIDRGVIGPENVTEDLDVEIPEVPPELEPNPFAQATTPPQEPTGPDDDPDQAEPPDGEGMDIS